MKINKILSDIGFDEFISFDLETTGLDTNKNEIIEIAAVKFKGGEYHSEFSTLVKPKNDIAKSITKITNITNSMVSNAPLIEEVLDDFINFVNHGNLIAHNIDFDLGFINKLLTTLPEKINIDTSRIYACGYSNGGFFSYGLACDLNSQIAAIGSVAGTMVSDTYENCQATVPKPMINIHGVNDPIVPYEGAPGLVSINNVLNFWSKLNFAENMEINFFEGVENYVYRDSLEIPMVSHFKIINGGHTWDYNSFLSSNTSTNELIWEFVSKFDINGYID